MPSLAKGKAAANPKVNHKKERKNEDFFFFKISIVLWIVKVYTMFSTPHIPQGRGKRKEGADEEPQETVKAVKLSPEEAALKKQADALWAVCQHLPLLACISFFPFFPPSYSFFFGLSSFVRHNQTTVQERSGQQSFARSAPRNAGDQRRVHWRQPPHTCGEGDLSFFV